ncbi:MAG: c-type cytochrome [Oleiphilaceae bacterium]|nr:c-type cytochrome [Oleiphilaceae bacterium]
MTRETLAVWPLLMALCLPALAVASDDWEVAPTASQGASVYLERCALCHGTEARGDGPLAMNLNDYPDTDLRKPVHAETLDEILQITLHGGSGQGHSQYMPPFGNELTWTEVHSVTQFVSLLRTRQQEALALLDESRSHVAPSRRVGQQIFVKRCVLCHGAFGEGDGRLARVITDPPPADLTKSNLSEPRTRSIITQGGKAVGRSPQMPPWGEQLSDSEITALIIYLQGLRETDG